MKTFVDNANRTWQIVINVDTVRRVRDLAKINLLDAVDRDLMERLALDPVLLCDTLYAICKAEADKNGITDKQFGEGLAGDAIEAATDALLEELADFFPSRTGKPMKLAIQKHKKLQEALSQGACRRVESLDVEKTAELLLKNSGGSSGNSPASSESTPDQEPSGKSSGWPTPVDGPNGAGGLP